MFCLERGLRGLRARFYRLLGLTAPIIFSVTPPLPVPRQEGKRWSEKHRNCTEKSIYNLTKKFSDSCHAISLFDGTLLIFTRPYYDS